MSDENIDVTRVTVAAYRQRNHAFAEIIRRVGRKLHDIFTHAAPGLSRHRPA